MAKKDKETGKQGQKNPSFFKELGEYINPYKSKYAGAILLSTLAVAFSLLGYGFAGKMMGELFAGELAVKTVAIYIGVIALCKVLYVLLLNFSTWMSHHAAYDTLRDIRKALTEKMIKMPLGYFEEQGSGRLKAVIVDRIESMENTLAHLFPEMTANLLVPLALFVWMFFLDWRMALIILVWIIVGMMFSCGMMIGYTEKYAGQIAAAKGMNQAVIEYVDGIEVIKTFNQTDVCYKNYENAVFHNAQYCIDWTKETQIFNSLVMAVTPISIFPTLIAGVYFWSTGSLTITNFFLFMILALGVYGPLEKAVGYFDQVAQMGTIAGEMKEILDYPELERSGKVSDEGDMELEMKDVSFYYSKQEGEVLSDISFKVPKGTMFALVGPSGSGKSTIAKLLAGYWDPRGGQITIGGKDMREFSQEKINQLIACVDQETFLFETTILENIRIGRPDATEEEVMEVAKRAGCDEFIKALPQGYDTQAGVAGGSLSGGEKQRIAIARAMMKDAPVMILDEATASADPENEALIQQALSEAAKDKTLIMVAHKLATIVMAEQIAYVENGRIKKIGTHEELLKECKEYADMWNLTVQDRGGEE